MLSSLPSPKTLQPFPKNFSKRKKFSSLSPLTNNQKLHPKNKPNFTNKIKTHNTKLHLQDTIINYCSKNQPIEAKQTLDLLIRKGYHPDPSTFNFLIDSFCKKGMLQNAHQVFDKMTEPSITTYNSLFKGLCYVGRVDEAYGLLANIKKSSLKPDIYTYTIVMNGLCKVGRSNEAMELLDEGLEMGLVPNVVTFNTLFNGYFKEGRPLEGIGLLSKMKGLGCVPDYVSYCTLLHGLLKWEEIKGGLLVYEEMVGKGFEVDERMTNSLLKGLCVRARRERGILKDANKVFEKMRNGGCVIYPSTLELVNETFY